MTEEAATPLALALDRLSRAGPGDETAARLAVYEALTASELSILLESEAEGGALSPRLFALDSGPTVLAFDSEAALADFAGRTVAYAALPGRVLVAMLAEPAAGGVGLSLMVQSGAGQGELLDPGALAWLARRLAAPAPRAQDAVAQGYGPPALPPGLLATLVPALERRLSGIPGLGAAVLAAVTWADGGHGHLLALGGVAAVAQPALARSVSEALEFAGLEAGLDVVFPPPAALAAIQAVGLALAPEPWTDPESRPDPAAPGSDPARPPRLR